MIQEVDVPSRALPQGGKAVSEAPLVLSGNLPPPYKSAAFFLKSLESHRSLSVPLFKSHQQGLHEFAMAEVVGTVSAIASLVTLALQSSIALYQTVQSLQSRDKVIRELRQELEALQSVLQALDESICNFEVDLTALKQPLMRCNNACGEFNALIINAHRIPPKSGAARETGSS